MIEFLRDFFFFDKENPMIFTSFLFWVFFLLILLVYAIIYKKKTLRHAFLFLASLFFYYKSSNFYFFLLIFSTIIDYGIGFGIYYSHRKWLKQVLVGLSVFVNLFVLSYFKYSYFYVDVVNDLFGTNLQVVNHFSNMANGLFGTHFDASVIILPVGISFFTFQTISYSIDIYREKIKPVRSILDFGFYVSFFPQLVAGPIVRASEFIPQLYKEYHLTKADFGLALFMILKGLVKKMFISDYIAVNFIDRVFETPLSYSGFENLMALYGYSLQVYADFSGYTDIAIGVALLLGFRLPVNFNSPYKARSVADFWRRWHISLSTWLKDYLYIPMGGNRKASPFTYIAIVIILYFILLTGGFQWLTLALFTGIVALFILTLLWPKMKLLQYIVLVALMAFSYYLYDVSLTSMVIFCITSVIWAGKIFFVNQKFNPANLNLMLTMLLGGLWHGSSWQFVIWGAINGMGLIVYKNWRRISPFAESRHWLVRFYGIFLTFNFITFTRIWFRSESMEVANNMMFQIVNDFTWSLIPTMIFEYKWVFGLILIGYIIHWLSTNVKAWYENLFIHSPVYVKGLLVVLIVFLIYQARTAELQPFIYFQF